LYYGADEPEILTLKNLEILFSRLLVSWFLLPAVRRITHLCLRCRRWQQVVGKWSQQWVFICIR